VNVPPRFTNAAPLKPSAASTNVAEAATASSRSSLVSDKPALASLMFGHSSNINQIPVEPDPGKDFKRILTYIVRVYCEKHLATLFIFAHHVTHVGPIVIV